VEGHRDGIRPGQLSDAACFSFYATKSLTCGEGGAVVTNRRELADKLRLLRLHGMTKTAADRQRDNYSHWDMVMLGWKYNMDNIQAALLLPQMARLEDRWRQRQRLAERYCDRLSGLPGLSWPRTLPGVCHAWHLFTVWIDGGHRDRVVRRLQERGIGVVVNYRAIHLLTYFRETLGVRAGAFPEAERIGDATLSLPLYAGLPDAHFELVVDALRASL
jgi:UDP-4-amino-4-deoxy-L-arabinose-oxoglutarate aminotransferase